MGFSRQKYWGGLPCPPPEDAPNPGIEPASFKSHWQTGSLPLKCKSESEVKVSVAQSCPTLMGCSPPDSSVHRILQARILEWVTITFSRGLIPDPGIEFRSPSLKANSLPSKPPREAPPKTPREAPPKCSFKLILKCHIYLPRLFPMSKGMLSFLMDKILIGNRKMTYLIEIIELSF